MLALLGVLVSFKIQTSVCSHDVTSAIGLHKSSAFVGDTLLQGLQDCKLYMILGNFRKVEANTRDLWFNAFEELISHKNLPKHSGGVINLQLFQNQSENQVFSILRPTRMTSHSCSATVLLLPSVIGHYEEYILTEKLAMPLLNPPTIKNQDKYVIITREENLRDLFQSKLINSIKYKLILTENVSGQVRVHTFCPYCPGGPIWNTILDAPRINHREIELNLLFPDLQKNYYGSTLRLSASDKVSVLMEVVKDKDGKYFAKRGVYASVLFHLMDKLNFTYDLVASSGGGSTGHQLSNGTWVGTVGDTYASRVDFGFMAAVTYQRFSVVELCATINYAYLGFGTGPPVRIYTWRAIFWPFRISMWIGMISSVCLSSIIASLLLKNCYLNHDPQSDQPKKTCTVMSMNQYFAKILIEQGEECPNGSNSVRAFFGFWLLFAIVATTAYKSKIVSFMMFPVVEIVPSTFEELAESNFEIDFHYFGNVAFNLFKTSTSPTFVTMYQRMEKEPDPLKCLQRTMTSKSVCIIFGITYERLRYRNLSDQIGNSPVRFSTHRGFMYTPGAIHEKKAALSPNFKLVINTAMEMGLIGEWKRLDFNQILMNKTAWEKETGLEETSAAENDDDVLHLRNLSGSFVILGVGIVMALCTFTGEKIYCRFRVTRLNPHRQMISLKF